MVAGFVCGALVMIYKSSPQGGGEPWHELFRRLAWAYHGGAGESADWGGPLFYLLLAGIPAGVLGAFVFLAASYFLIKR